MNIVLLLLKIHTYFKPIAPKRGLVANIRVAVWISPRNVPKSNAVDAEAMCIFFLIGFDSLLFLLLVTIEDLLVFELVSDNEI